MNKIYEQESDVNTCISLDIIQDSVISLTLPHITHSYSKLTFKKLPFVWQMSQIIVNTKQSNGKISKKYPVAIAQSG